jgi:branched-chain amino acid transport system substrate-binding protein
MAFAFGQSPHPIEATMTIRRGIGIAVTSAVALSGVAACGSSNAAASKAPYDFAVIGPLSGADSVYGQDLQMGTNLAAEQINQSGGIDGHKIQLTYLDTQCLATDGANIAARIASDPSYFAVIGDVCSSATLAEIPILARASITIMSPDSTSPLITQAVEQKHYANFARNIPTDAQMAQSMVTLATQVLHKTKIGILYADDDFGQPVFSYQKPDIARAGAAIANAETYTPSETTDFTPQLSRLKAAGIDVLLIDGYYNDAGVAVAQLARAGLAGIPVIGSAGIDEPEYMKLAGPAANGDYIFSYYNPENPSQANQKFLSAFKLKYGKNATASAEAYAVWGYEIPFIYEKAIEAGATKRDLAAMVKKVTFDGPTGLTRFDANGDVIGKSAIVLLVKNGQFVFDGPVSQEVK